MRGGIYLFIFFFSNATNGAQGFQAYPGATVGVYSVWLTGEATPAGIKDCIPFAAKAAKVSIPLKCNYS
jgi:hypothetical protein